MGSLRTPVGPLPSSIYWRRRLVVLLLIAVIVLLVLWALRPGGDSGSSDGDGDANGPAESITPGPTPSESFIDERPGGRETPTDDASGDPGGAEGGDEGADGGSGGGSTGGDGGTGEEDGATGGAGTAGGGGSGGESVTGLPECGQDDVTLALSTDENEYALDEKPEIRLTVTSAAGVSCRVDFGYGGLTITLTDAENEQVWSSAECPSGDASAPAAVPAGGSTTHTLTWDRRHSTDDCADPSGPAAAAGTYLAEAQLAGFSTVPQVPFSLDND
ncbi:hypothetical protein [Streptomyces sp. B6B3]|uniref:hypothetical protein n=1 Tax=Streptomyces sp. B6B3 TaxID=3153570 RepID=UPI00325D1F04